MAIPLNRYETMDPFILLSAVNMLLRDEGIDLNELCAREEISEEILVKRLADAGFAYDANSRQFK